MKSMLAAVFILLAVGTMAFSETSFQIVKGEDLEFGTIFALTTGSMTLTPATDGTVSVTMSGVLPVRSNQYKAAKFTVTGQANRRFYFQLPTGACSLGTGVTLDTFTVATSARSGDDYYLNSSGTATLYVGATLHITSAGAGSYTGDFPIDVAYDGLFTITVQ